MSTKERASHSPPIDGFLAARREWDDRYGHLSKDKRAWQWICLALLLVVVGDGWTIYALLESRGVVPYVIEIGAAGEPVATGPAQTMEVPDEKLVRYQLALFVRNFRTELADPEAQALLTADAYAMAQGRARELIRDYLESRANDRLGKRERTRVEVESVLPLSGDTWQVQWSERTTGRHILGERVRSVRAVLTVLWEPPETIEEMNDNPLGIFVTEIHWSETT